MTMIRALFAAAAVAIVTGLQIHDVDDDDDHDDEVTEFYDNLTSQTDVVAGLDPMLTRVDGKVIHVTKPGDYLMIGMPSDLNMDRPESAELMVEAEFQKLTDQKCEDLMIRKVTVQGFTLGTNITKLEFSIASDAFSNSSTAVLGLSVTNKREDGREQTLTFSDFNTSPGPLDKPVDHFSLFAPYCTISRPKGYIKPPTKRSHRGRQPVFIAECSLEWGKHTLKIVYNSVWRGNDGVRDIRANDLSLSIGGVGDKPAGLLGTDDFTEETKAIPGCNKKQPVNGPYQTRKPKGKPHRQHWSKWPN